MQGNAETLPAVWPAPDWVTVRATGCPSTRLVCGVTAIVGGVRNAPVGSNPTVAAAIVDMAKLPDVEKVAATSEHDAVRQSTMEPVPPLSTAYVRAGRCTTSVACPTV